MTLHVEHVVGPSLGAHVVAAPSLSASKTHDKSTFLLLWLAILFLKCLLKPPTLMKPASVRYQKGQMLCRCAFVPFQTCWKVQQSAIFVYGKLSSNYAAGCKQRAKSAGFWRSVESLKPSLHTGLLWPNRGRKLKVVKCDNVGPLAVSGGILQLPSRCH